MWRVRKLFTAVVAVAVCAAAVVSPASAQSSFGSSSPTSPDASVSATQWASKISEGLKVTRITDLFGRGLSDFLNILSGDLGMMAPLGSGEEFAIIFGDSFRGHTVGQGEWLSPIGARARLNAAGEIEMLAPLNDGAQVEQLLEYEHTDMLTLLPSDVINIRGTLYMQGMWNRGVGNVLGTEIWRSTDNGQTWQSVAKTSTSYMGGMGNLITWEQGPDGYIYVMSSQFQRNDPVYLSRFREADIADRSKWDLYDPTTGQWGTTGRPILDERMKAGEMSLRYIQGHWVLAMFNQATMAIEVRISDTIARDWDAITPANVVIAGHGGWSAAQTPSNFTQLYGGYIVPGSTLNNLDLVVSQWNTGTNARYNSTQFNVRGLETFFGIGARPATRDADALDVTAHTPTR